MEQCQAAATLLPVVLVPQLARSILVRLHRSWLRGSQSIFVSGCFAGLDGCADVRQDFWLHANRCYLAPLFFGVAGPDVFLTAAQQLFLACPAAHEVAPQTAAAVLVMAPSQALRVPHLAQKDSEFITVSDRQLAQ